MPNKAVHREPVIFDVAVHAGWVNLSVMRFHVPKLTTTGMLLVLVANVAAQQPTRRGWKNINAEGLFRFRLPVGFRQSEMGIDTYMRGYQRGRARFIFVCGDSASDEYDEKIMRRAREVPLSVAGKQAMEQLHRHRKGYG